MQETGIRIEESNSTIQRKKSESEDAKSQNSSNTIGSTGNKVKTAYSGNTSKKDSICTKTQHITENNSY